MIKIYLSFLRMAISDMFSVNDDDDDDVKEHIKLLNLSLANEDVQNDSPIEDLVTDFEEVNNHHKEDIKTIHLETSINFEETEIPMPLETEQTHLNSSGDDFLDLTNGGFDLKNVTINETGISIKKDSFSWTSSYIFFFS